MARKAGKVSIFTMAAELGISAATVSRVLNNRTGPGEETRRAVLKLARKYDFKLNYPQQHKPLIATIVRPQGGINSYMASVLSGINSYFNSRDLMACTICCDPEKDHSILQAVRDQQCSGVIIIQSTYFAGQLPELAASGLPVMLIDDRSDIDGIGYVDNDSYSGAVELTGHLLQLGHRKIGFLTRWADDLNHIQRLQGFLDTMKNAGIEVPEEWVIYYSDEFSPMMPECSGEMFEKLLNTAPGITAVISVNDDLALGVMHKAHQMNLQIPGDISIAGFDDQHFCKALTPSLTTVYHPSSEAGFQAAQAIDAFLKSNGKDVLPKLVLPTRLVARESTGRVTGKNNVSE